ncbi:MAG: DUF1761 domain-containing protein [Bacteroidetes bacterium]|nr:DUF1761 domain-containing protein [Bacteroidota bacterium]MBU2505575.1 DUF1761 domain-containing protein [Bacteroidota bacterium]
MHSIEINYLAVLVCGILSMVVGFLWYGPIFGKAWMKEVGKTEEELKKEFNPAKTYSLSVLGQMIMALALAYVFSLAGAESIMEGLRIGLAVWLGLTFAPFLVNGLYEGISNKLLFLNTGYQLANTVVFTVVLILW